jgi:hypothetical protein
MLLVKVVRRKSKNGMTSIYYLTFRRLNKVFNQNFFHNFPIKLIHSDFVLDSLNFVLYILFTLNVFLIV